MTHDTQISENMKKALVSKRFDNFMAVFESMCQMRYEINPKQNSYFLFAGECLMKSTSYVWRVC